MSDFPKNPDILVGIINLKLRDFYSSFSDLCEDLDYDSDEVEGILNRGGYFYDGKNHQFKQK